MNETMDESLYCEIMTSRVMVYKGIVWIKVMNCVFCNLKWFRIVYL